MQEIKLRINKTEVYEEVAKTSAYLGAKTVDKNGKNIFDQVFVTDADKEMLERSWNGAKDNVSYVLGNNLKLSVEEDDEWLLNLGMTDNFPRQFVSSLESTIKDYVVNYVIAGWCEVADKGEVENYANQSGQLLMQVNNLLSMRMRPTRNF